MKALQLILFILLMVFSTVRGWASAAATLTNHNLLYFQIDALPTAIPTNVIMLTGNLTNWQKLVTNVICSPCLIINPTIPRVPYKFGPAQFMDSSLLWQSDTNTYSPTLELGLAPAYWTDPRPDLGGFFKVDNRGMGVINAVEFQSGITSNDNGGATFKIQMGDYDVGHNATTYAANINTSVDSFNAVPTGDQTDGAIAIYGGSDGNGVRNIGVNGATGGEATNNIAVLAGADRDNVLGRTNIALKADIADPGAWSPVQISGFFDVGRHASTPSNETAMVLIDNRSTGYPLIVGRTNNGTRQFYVAASTGYSGTGTNFLSDDGTYKPGSGLGITINPTDLFVPYRINATTFGDSLISYQDDATTWVTATNLVNDAHFALRSTGTNCGSGFYSISLSDSSGIQDVVWLNGLKGGTWGAGTPATRSGVFSINTLYHNSMFERFEIDGNLGTIKMFDKTGVQNFQLSDVSGYTGTGTNYLSDDGTYKPCCASGIVTNVMNALNVKDPPFNAKGDGSVNDAPALQLAINTATAHSPVLNVFIPAGVYKIQSTLTVTNSVEILGAGSGELETTPGHITVIQKDADVVAFQLSAKHIALRNLTVQGSGDSTEGILIGDATTDAGDAILDNVTVRLCGSDGIWVKNGNCCHLRVDTWGNLGHGLHLESVVVAFDNVNANVVDLKATSNGLDGLRMVKSAVNMVKVVSQGNGGWGIYNGYPNSMIEAYTEANTSGSYYGTASAFSGTLSGKFNEGDPVMDNRYNIVQNSNATNSWFRFLYNVATATNLTVETDANLQGFVHANRLTATNGIIHKFKSSFSTDYSIGTATNQQFFLLNGTNQLITLPPAAGVQGIIYRFSMTNGWGSFILTNAADGATIRDGTSLSYTNIGINEVGLLSDGSNWWLASKGKQIFPAASWSLNASITPVQDVITNLPFDTLEFNNSQGIALKTNALFAKPTQLWITNSGTYMITFSAVLKGSAGGSKISIWLRKNGSDVARTRTDQGFSGATAQQCMTVNYFVKVDTPAYYELCAASHDASPPTIEYAVANPTGYTAPAMPAIIVTINRVSDPWP